MLHLLMPVMVVAEVAATETKKTARQAFLHQQQFKRVVTAAIPAAETKKIRRSRPTSSEAL